jgi:uncharacterized protein YjiS (DUF1127 family)
MSTLITRITDDLVGRFENWRARERAYWELTSLDDRSLADIGLTRGDISFVLEGRTSRLEPINNNEPERNAA